MEQYLSLSLSLSHSLSLSFSLSLSLSLSLQAPASVDTTDDPDNWTVLYTQEGSSNAVDLTVFNTSVIISDLDRGTSYTAAVTGNNVRGPGAVSEPVTAQTLVDRKNIYRS